MRNEIYLFLLKKYLWGDLFIIIRFFLNLCISKRMKLYDLVNQESEIKLF